MMGKGGGGDVFKRGGFSIKPGACVSVYTCVVCMCTYTCLDVI